MQLRSLFIFMFVNFFIVSANSAYAWEKEAKSVMSALVKIKKEKHLEASYHWQAYRAFQILCQNINFEEGNFAAMAVYEHQYFEVRSSLQKIQRKFLSSGITRKLYRDWIFMDKKSCWQGALDQYDVSARDKTEKVEKLIFKAGYQISKSYGKFAHLFKASEPLLISAKNLEADLLEKLQPLDIIVVKPPENITSISIPGQFGHVAIYVGDGKLVEYTLQGSKYNPISDLKEVDQILVVRVKNLANREAIFAKIKEMEGYEYDFQFDLTTRHLLTCAEFVYYAFDFIPWNYDWRAARPTITPDDFFATASNRQDVLEIPYFWVGQKNAEATRFENPLNDIKAKKLLNIR